MFLITGVPIIRKIFFALALLATPAFADDYGMHSFNQAQVPVQPQQVVAVVKHHGGSISSLVRDAANRNGIPPHILHGVVMVESHYNCKAHNPSGATGIGQVKPATARSVGITGSLYDCRNGIEAAARYLKLALNTGGGGCAGIGLYERGIYARPTCTGYGRKVLAYSRGVQA